MNIISYLFHIFTLQVLQFIDRRLPEDISLEGLDADFEAALWQAYAYPGMCVLFHTGRLSECPGTRILPSLSASSSSLNFDYNYCLERFAMITIK